MKSPNDTSHAQVVKTQIATFLCPSDVNRMTVDIGDGQFGWGKNNYKANAGNDTGQWFASTNKEQNNGIFVTNQPVRITQVTDGTSHTALFSEAMLGDGDDNHIEAPSDWFRISTADSTAAQVVAECTSMTPEAGAGNQFSRSGRNWVFGNYVTTRYNHVMPPNSRSCPLRGRDGRPYDLCEQPGRRDNRIQPPSRWRESCDGRLFAAVRGQRHRPEGLVRAGQSQWRRTGCLALVKRAARRGFDIVVHQAF